MKLLHLLSFGGKKINRKVLSDYKQELLVKQGAEQFKKLIERGINVPIVLL